MSEVIPITSETVDRPPADLPRMVRLALGYGAKLRYGSLEIALPDGRAVKLGNNGPGPAAAMKVYDFGFASRLIRGGDIGIAEAYLRGDWDTPDLTQFLYLFCVNQDWMRSMLARQADGAGRSDGPALAQPQYKTSGPSQHLQTLRYRKCLLFGMA